MSFDQEKPYNELPDLPVAKDLETKDVLKKTISATRALAHLNGVAETIPNPTMLINTILLKEAQASSEIENIVTTKNL